MSKDFAPPKYAQVMGTIQERIEAGQYAAGDMLPSETQLVREFGVGRTTVVRALQTLAMQGWIEREHGRGSFVKGRPESAADRIRPGLAVAEQAENGDMVTDVARVPAPRHIARLLGVEDKTPVISRRRVARQGAGCLRWRPCGSRWRSRWGPTSTSPNRSRAGCAITSRR